jgi:hypothetical protein
VSGRGTFAVARSRFNAIRGLRAVLLPGIVSLIVSPVP